MIENVNLPHLENWNPGVFGPCFPILDFGGQRKIIPENLGAFSHGFHVQKDRVFPMVFPMGLLVVFPTFQGFVFMNFPCCSMIFPCCSMIFSCFSMIFSCFSQVFHIKSQDPSHPPGAPRPGAPLRSADPPPGVLGEKADTLGHVVTVEAWSGALRSSGGWDGRNIYHEQLGISLVIMEYWNTIP